MRFIPESASHDTCLYAAYLIVRRSAIATPIQSAGFCSQLFIVTLGGLFVAPAIVFIYYYLTSAALFLAPCVPAIAFPFALYGCALSLLD